MVPLAGIEPTAYPLGEGRSILLSYRGEQRATHQTDYRISLVGCKFSDLPTGLGMPLHSLASFVQFLLQRPIETSQSQHQQYDRGGNQQNPASNGQGRGQGDRRSVQFAAE